jgi:type I restriction-modification system DNA methylase subunit
MADNHHRKHGIYYTPSVLADYLAAPLITDAGVKILDPAYGEGALLLAAERQYHRKFPNSSLHLFGCDIKPVNGLLRHLPEANLKK